MVSLFSPVDGAASPCSTRDRANDEQGFVSLCNHVRQRRVRRLVAEVFFAREEAQKRSPLERVMIADRAAQHRVARFECVENATQRDGHHFALHAREIAQVVG